MNRSYPEYQLDGLRLAGALRERPPTTRLAEAIASARELYATVAATTEYGDAQVEVIAEWLLLADAAALDGAVAVLRRELARCLDPAVERADQLLRATGRR